MSSRSRASVSWWTPRALGTSTSTVDFTGTFIGSGFEVSNPNVVASCGCGSSFRVAEEKPQMRRVRLTADRDLDWDGCVNARDLGGLPTLDGGVTRRGALVRSEMVDRLSPEGWRALRDHGVRTMPGSPRGRRALAQGDDLALQDGCGARPHPLDRIADDTEFWGDWMHGPQFGTPLYYAAFGERFPERIEQVLDAIEQAPPAAAVPLAGGRAAPACS